MSTATDTLTKVEDQVLEYVSRVQEPVVDGLRKAAEAVEGYVPELSLPAVGDKVPTATELVENSFEFAQRVLDNQHRFAKAVLDATAPVRNKVETSAPAKKPAAKTAAGPKAA